MAEQWTEKLQSGSVRIPVQITKENDRLYLQFKYSPPLMAEIKAMAGRKYHGYDQENPRKVWSISDCPRNRFQLDFLAGRNPYSWWERELVDFKSNRKELRSHQCQMAAAGLTYHYVLFAAEPGVGKSLSAIEVMEQSGIPDWFYVAPQSALNGVKLELMKWRCRIKPMMMTYEQLVKLSKNWQKGNLPPHGVVFDESSRLKNHTTQRTQAAQWLADGIRETWGNRGFVIEMSGTPAPNNPGDWWSACEVLAPGYIREGHVLAFRQRLALIEQVESAPGLGSFPKLVTWWDNENKCKSCGKLKTDKAHDEMSVVMGDGHQWEKSTNEIDYLYKRMKGLVHVFLKKDCLDLPDKQYRLIFCPPTLETLNAMEAIKSRSPSAIQALTLMRELSDGFQYKDIPRGVEVCPLCEGNRIIAQQSYIGPAFTEEELEKAGVVDASCHPDVAQHPEWWKKIDASCEHCKGVGEVTHYERESVEGPTPKEDALKEILDLHEDIGRLVIYAGFTGSIDRVAAICSKASWHTIIVDGRGWRSDLPIKDQVDLLRVFQDVKGFGESYEKVAFIAHPYSGGMGITLTSSPTIVFWSNDFNGESRAQAEERIHRLGMDQNRGATIIDLIHLPSDLLILQSLKAKRELQAMSMGELERLIEKSKARRQDDGV